MYLNNVVISGNLTKNPEVRVLSDREKPVTVTNFILANNEPKKDGKTAFVKVTAFGRTAEVVGEYLAKGQPVIVVGSLKQNSFENAEGQKVNYSYIQADNVQMFPKKNGSSQQQEPVVDTANYVDENDIPF
ncbi:single-stranded DNA-binding protein [Flexistipes sp.]|uniref:single-stranded DNA-binding protein n=1 Tax=Flexistipes sp. TaxID=3088135 RepID=UPI002E2260F2|nr:single-stranded DNA-binding protein [Flexistipes sp.]